MNSIDLFIEQLGNEPEYPEITNLYAVNSKEGHLRRDNLKLYLSKMKRLNPKFLLLGEAPGYKGCRLTGIPFTSEYVLVTNTFFEGQGFKLVNDFLKPETESSATIVWEQLEHFPDKPLIWNIFPFHPHIQYNVRTNRTPATDELEVGKVFLEKLLEIFDIKKIIALGRNAERQVADLNIDSVYVRHPANGGKPKFVSGLHAELK